MIFFCLFSTGIKVIGGVKELTGEEFGVYVKRILPGGLASSDGKNCFSFIIQFNQNYYPKKPEVQNTEAYCSKNAQRQERKSIKGTIR